MLSNEITLDGRNSHDPDDDSSSLQFIWTCVQMQKSMCLNSDGSAIHLQNVPRVLLIQTIPLGLYTFVLQVCSSDGRTAFAQAQLNVTDTGSQIGIFPISLSSSRKGRPFQLNIGRPFALFAQDLTYNLPANSLWTANKNVDVKDAEICPLGAHGSSIFFSGQKLLGVLSFRVHATTLSSHASVDIFVNLPPQGGLCNVFPAIGNEATLFTSSCSGLTDEHLPISFGIRYSNLATKVSVQLPATVVPTRIFMLPSGTFLVHVISCDAFQSCSDAYSTSLVVDPSPNARAKQITFLKDSLARGQLFQMMDTVKLISQSISPVPRNRLLLQEPVSIETDILIAMLNATLSTRLNEQLAIEFVKSLQALPSNAVATNGINSFFALKALKKLCQDSTGYITFSVILPFLQAIFAFSDPTMIPEIMSTASICSKRSASDILIGQTPALAFDSVAAWTVKALPRYGNDIFDSFFSFQTKSSSLPTIFVSKNMSTSINPSNMVLLIMSTFPNPWRNRRGPWVTPAVSFSVVNKDANAANLESKGSLPLSTFILNLPLHISKVPIMSQNLSVLKQKLVPKSWDLVSTSWLETSCQLLSLNETECSISCTNLGIFAVEYNSELFVCGDGVRDLIEGCDDWNNVNGDGCDSRCNVEVGWTCQKGRYPSEKNGFDLCNRHPCFAPYNCRSKGLCMSDDTCFCDAGFFGDECNQTLPIHLQTSFNYTWIQLPFSLYAGYDAETEPLFILTVNRGGNLTHDVNGSTVVASVTVYKPEMFPVHSFRKNATSAADPELKSIFLSNIFEIRITTSGNIVVNAKGRVFVAMHLSLSPPFLDFSLFNTTGRTTKNNANSTIQINLCKFSVLNKAWQPVEDSIETVFLARRTVYDFNAVGPNYYALMAITRVMRSEVQEQLQPEESDYSIVAAIAAGISGGVFLIAALYTVWYIRRRNQRRMVLAAYYAASAAAARNHNRKFFTDSKIQNSIPPPPESGHAGPRKKQLSKKPVVQQPLQVSVLNAEPPPPIQGLSANKSLVAAAIRSKIKNANILHRSMPAFRLDQDLEFELDLTEDSETFIPRNSNDIEYFENLGDALEVDSVDSEGNGERHLDASSSCSAISLADKSDGSASDLEDAGIAPPAMLPVNDFEDDLHSSNQSPSVSAYGANLLHPSESSLRQNADLWKKQNNTSFDA